MSELTKNDQRTLEHVADACEKFDGFIPHGAASHTAIRRLLAAGLVECPGFAQCETCQDEHEAPYYVKVSR